MAVNNSAGEPWLAHYAHACAWDTAFPPLALPDLFAAAARQNGDKPLVDFLGRRFSYRELHTEARRFAAGLQALDLPRGERIGLYLPNVPIYVSAYYGAMLAGMTVVNFSPLYSAEELAVQVRGLDEVGGRA